MTEEEDALVRLARVTRVEAHKRRSKTGKSEHVDSYLRKILDKFGVGADSDTERGLYTNSTWRSQIGLPPRESFPGERKARAQERVKDNDASEAIRMIRRGPAGQELFVDHDIDITSIPQTDAEKAETRAKIARARATNIPKRSRDALREYEARFDGEPSDLDFPSYTEDYQRDYEWKPQDPGYDMREAERSVAVWTQQLETGASPDSGGTSLRHAHAKVWRALQEGETPENPEKLLASWQAIMALAKPYDVPSWNSKYIEMLTDALREKVSMSALDRLAAGVVSLSDSDRELILDLAAQWEDDENIVALGSRASLDRSPKKNWVENAGQLPGYVREIANSLVSEKGFTISRAIATALSRLKVWAVTGKPDTKAKSIAALAQWEKLKARNRLNKAKK